MKIAIVSGASSGMGQEFVRQLAKAYPKLDEIWVLARRAERLEELRKSVSKKLRILPCDLSKESTFAELKGLLEEQQPFIKILVNSAGFGKTGTFLEVDFIHNLGMIDVNCRALTAMSYLCLPYMKEESRVINLASAASFIPQPNFTVYAASKSFVLSFSRALNRELKSRKISVTAVCPGPVETEFFQNAGNEAEPARLKKLSMADPKKVVYQAILDSAKKRDMSVYGFMMKGTELAAKVLPHNILLTIMRHVLK